VSEAPERKDAWPLWEVFVRSAHGLNHRHVGSLHAPDSEMALRNARDVYTRRNEGVSIWIVRSTDIVSTDSSERDAFFAAPQDKPFRQPTYFTVPEGVKHL
jgi:ring-1,2-phenylacetyl-CoA epoxidase subunit PaaB